MDFEEFKKPHQNQFTVKSNIKNYDDSYNNHHGMKFILN